MPNTNNAKMVALSQKIYKEWTRETILVQSCAREFEGELDLQTRELDIPVYHDLSVHKTTIKENELKPVGPEFIKASTKRVTIDKGRYSHWAETKLQKLIQNLSQENSETRKKLVNKWAKEADTELAVYCAKLPATQTIDLKTLLTTDQNTGGVLNTGNIFTATDILKAHVETQNMTLSDFTLFTSSQFHNLIRDAKILLGNNLDANAEFRKGYVGSINDLDLRQINIPEITTRDNDSKLVKAEWGIFKTHDGIQYVVPYKNTISYEISPTEVLMGGTGYQQVEYYDFFNLYPTRLYKVNLVYVAAATAPSL